MSRYLVSERSEFDRIFQDADGVFDTQAAFPGPVCRIEDAESFWFEDATVAAGGFWPDLQKLALLHGDTHVEIAVIDPDSITYFFRNFGRYSAIRLPVEATAQNYWDALTEGPPGSDADALRYNADRWIAVGGSKAWGLWCERGVELAAVYSSPLPGLHKWLDTLATEPLTLDDAEGVLSRAYRNEVPADVRRALRESWPNSR